MVVVPCFTYGVIEQTVDVVHLVTVTGFKGGG